MERWEDPSYAQTRLAADAMYFYAAVDAFHRADAARQAIAKVEAQWESVLAVERRLERHFEEAGDPDPCANRADAYEATSIQLVDGLQPALEGAHAPQVAALAQVHIFCSAALEAHVNIIAHGHLTRGQFQAFDKLPLYGKWMFLPSAFGKQPLDPGCEPVQSVRRLSSLRNDLIHHKPIREAWRLRELPQFVADLGLTVEQGAESLKGVDTAVARLASIMSRPKPRWLSHRPSSWLTSDAYEDLVDSTPRSP